MKETKRYWDTTCFLAWLKEEPDKVDFCRGVIQGCQEGRIKLITSTLTLAEVLFLRRGPKIPPEDAEKIKAFFEHRYIAAASLDRSTAEKAQEIFWNYDIKPNDAVHAATAVRLGIQIFDTFDPDFDKLHGNIGNPPLIVGKPNHPYQFTIDEKDKKKT